MYTHLTNSVFSQPVYKFCRLLDSKHRNFIFLHTIITLPFSLIVLFTANNIFHLSFFSIFMICSNRTLQLLIICRVKAFCGSCNPDFHFRDEFRPRMRFSCFCQYTVGFAVRCDCGDHAALSCNTLVRNPILSILSLPLAARFRRCPPLSLDHSEYIRTREQNRGGCGATSYVCAALVEDDNAHRFSVRCAYGRCVSSVLF